MQVIVNILLIALVCTCVGVAVLLLASGALYAARAVTPATHPLHGIVGRWIENLPETFNRWWPREVTVLFYGSLIFVAALTIYHG